MNLEIIFTLLPAGDVHSASMTGDGGATGSDDGVCDEARRRIASFAEEWRDSTLGGVFEKEDTKGGFFVDGFVG